MSILDNLIIGLPALVGVIWGIYIYKPDWSSIWQVFALAGGGLLFLWLGRFVMKKTLIWGTLFIEFWVFSAVSMIVLSTHLIIWVTIKAPSFFTLEDTEAKTVATLLVGAITGFLAILWVKDIQEGSGVFSSGKQFKDALSSAFKSITKKPERDSRPYDAIYYDNVRNGPSGWGMRSRWKRIKIIRKELLGL